MTTLRAAASMAGMVAATLAVAGVGAQPGAPSATPSRVIKITGDAHKLLLRADGSVAGWGRVNHGQLGPLTGIRANARMQAATIVAIALPGKAIDIAAGDNSSYALLEDGTVMAWGRADSGALGIGAVEPPVLPLSTPSMQYRGIDTPTLIDGLTDVTAIAASGSSAYALLRDGTVRSWGGAAIGDGRARSDYAGPPDTTGPALRPVTVPHLEGITALSAGGGTVLAIGSEGRVLSWGSNFYGALGRPPRVELVLDTPGEILGLTDVAQVVAGNGVSTALKKDGTVWVWGSNWQQQFGFPAPTVQPGLDRGWTLEPQQVPGITGAAEIAVGINGRHTLVRLKDGTLRVWGNADWGQLGTGAGPGYQPRPTAITIGRVSSIFAAGNNSFAVLTDGSLWAWGAGGSGEFPLTSNVRRPAPAPPGLR